MDKIINTRTIILSELQKGWRTAYQLNQFAGTTEARKRISELRQMGWNVETKLDYDDFDRRAHWNLYHITGKI
jgi:hypothetical protein